MPHALPACAASTLTLREQVLEQVDQEDQLVRAQSTGQASSLQLTASLRLGHTLLLCRADAGARPDDGLAGSWNGDGVRGSVEGNLARCPGIGGLAGSWFGDCVWARGLGD